MNRLLTTLLQAAIVLPTFHLVKWMIADFKENVL